MANQRQLPEIQLEGTTFLVDVEAFKLVAKGSHDWSISFLEMNYRDNEYHLPYNTRYHRAYNNYDDPADLLPVKIPALTKLDPEGVAMRYNLDVAQLAGKSDYEIMTDRQALMDRINGRLTTVDIAGHTFYVDFPMETIRPKDDFHTMGIRFDNLDEHYDEFKHRYEIPYNKRTHEMEELDYDNLIEVPKDVILVAIPDVEALDPIGYARAHGWDYDFILKEHPQQAHFKAEVLTGKDFWLDERIRENRERLGIKPDQAIRRGKKL